MGKVRRLRKKYHLACQKEETAKTEASTPIVPVVKSLPGRVEVPLKLDSDSNIFSGLTISLSDLKQTLLPPPTGTAVLGSVSEASVAGSVRTEKNKPRRKKDRKIERRELLLEKLAVTRKAAIDAKKRKAPPKLPKPMSVLTLIDALPSVSSICKDNKKTETSRSGEKSTETSQRDKTLIHKTSSPLGKKRRQKQLLADMKDFKTVLSNKQYKIDPFSAISNYLQKTVSQNMSWQKK